MDNMDLLFDFLYRNNIFPDNINDEVDKLGKHQLVDFIEKCYELVPENHDKANSTFQFVVNSRLSGLPIGCAALECRINNIDRLARFASLFADKVYINNLFIKNYFNFENIEMLKTELMIRLHLLFYIKPLLDSDVINFSISKICLCSKCYSDYKPIEEKINLIKDFLSNRYLDETKFILERIGNSNIFSLINTGPEDLIEHSKTYSIIFYENLPKIIQNRLRQKNFKELTKGELIESNFIDHRINPIINDLMMQNFCSNIYNANYITDRDLDLELIKNVNNLETNLFNEAFLDGFLHYIPFIKNVNLKNLIKLREKEGEAFKVYRDNISNTLNSAMKLSKKEIKEAIDNTILPEINKINLTIRNSKKLLVKSLTKDIIIGTGAITIGLFSGLLPNDIGKIIAALGGFKYISSLFEKGIKIFEEPHVIRDNKYYFLWKVLKETKERKI